MSSICGISLINNNQFNNDYYYQYCVWRQQVLILVANQASGECVEGKEARPSPRGWA
ncbi:hypothetical protein HMPREF0208_03040 [Citrobacter koseri]|nr:hypothetical protein HMPREF3207_04713 [Citrobacter koseri]KXB42815.1 hypothetical protein HMPREF0208_03040 [Citrobacter koseri]